VIAIPTTAEAVAIGPRGIAIGIGLSPLSKALVRGVDTSVVPMVRHGVCRSALLAPLPDRTVTQGFEMDVDNHVLAVGTKVTHR
jgi:hypothetical protein